MRPAAGNGNGSSLNNSGSNGNYWSSTPNSDNSNNAWNLNFNSSNFNANNNNRYNGFPVRPVRELAAVPSGDTPHHLLEDLYRAYLAARRHKRGKGYQIRFEMNQERELVRLRDELLSNVYLGILDEFVKRELKVRHYGRYVDDVSIVGETKEELKALIGPIREFLKERLHLELSEGKTRIVAVRHGVEFLGAFVKPFRTYASGRSLRRIRNHVHSVTPRMRMARAQAVGQQFFRRSLALRQLLCEEDLSGEEPDRGARADLGRRAQVLSERAAMGFEGKEIGWPLADGKGKMILGNKTNQNEN